MVYTNGGRLSSSEKWVFNNERLEVVKGFQYVGVFLSQQLSFPKMASEQAVTGKRVLISLLSRLYKFGQLNQKSYFKIFDTKIAPILTYGSEIWGTEEHKSIESIQVYACKRYMCVPQKTTNIAVLCDC